MNISQMKDNLLRKMPIHVTWNTLTEDERELIGEMILDGYVRDPGFKTGQYELSVWGSEFITKGGYRGRDIRRLKLVIIQIVMAIAIQLLIELIKSYL